MLVSSNAPEWGMTYFGVLKAGATCIPAIPKVPPPRFSTSRAGNAAGIICSEAIINDHPDLQERLAATGLGALVDVQEVFALPDEETEDQRIALLPQRAHAQSVASLIFTSGTTGQPKGVMLSHRNLTSMVSMLSSVLT